MFNEYGIGRDDKGILILLSVEDRDVRIEVGNALEEYINDAKAGRLMDTYAIPDFKEKKFADGLIKLQDGTIKELSALMNGEESTLPEDDLSTSQLSLIISIIMIVAIVVILAVFNDDGDFFGGGYFGGGFFSGSSGSSSSGSSGFGGHSSGGGASRHF